MTIILTTHNMREAEMLCHEVGFLGEGRILAQGGIPSSPGQLALGDRVTLAFAGQLPEFDFQALARGVAMAAAGRRLVELVVDHSDRRLPGIFREIDRGRGRRQPGQVEALTWRICIVSLVTEAVKVWAFAARGGIMNRRNVFAVFEMLFWPLMGLFSVGLLTRFLELGPETVSFVLIGAVAMNTVQIAQLDVSYALLYDVWAKSLKHGLIAPINLVHVVLGAGLVGLIRGLVVFGLMLGLGIWAFGMDLSLQGWPALVPFLRRAVSGGPHRGVVVLSLVLLFGHRAKSPPGLFRIWCCSSRGCITR